MKAAIRTGWTGYALSFTSNHPEPIPTKLKPNQILIHVKSAAINPVDYKLPRMVLGSVFGLDFAGTIEAIGNMDSNNGSNIDSFKIGDAVFGRCKGSLAEKTITEMDEVYKKPSFLSFEEAAALATAYMTGIQGLSSGGIDMSPLSANEETKPNKSVLVIGASGGCGIAALQLLKGMNEKRNGSISRIVGICSHKNSDFVLKNGATEVVDYTNQLQLNIFFIENKGKFDCVYDCSTGSGGKTDAYYKMSQTLLKVGLGPEPIMGQYVALNGSPSLWTKALIGRTPKNQTMVMTKKSQSDLHAICELLEAANMKPSIDVKSFTKEGVEEGFKLLKSRRAKGKIVFSVFS